MKTYGVSALTWWYCQPFCGAQRIRAHRRHAMSCLLKQAGLRRAPIVKRLKMVFRRLYNCRRVRDARWSGTSESRKSLSKPIPVPSADDSLCPCIASVAGVSKADGALIPFCSGGQTMPLPFAYVKRSNLWPPISGVSFNLLIQSRKTLQNHALVRDAVVVRRSTRGGKAGS